MRGCVFLFRWRGVAGWSVVVIAALSLCLSDVPSGLPFISHTARSRLPQLALRGAGDAGADYAEPELTREELEKELDKLRWGLGSEDWHARVCRAFFSGRALPRPERAWMPCCGHRTAGTLTGLAFLSLQRGNAKHPARAVLPRHRQRAGWYPA